MKRCIPLLGMVGLVAWGVGCGDDGDDELVSGEGGAGSGGDGVCVPGAADPTPIHYAAKIKGLFTGGALTTDELSAIESDPASLRGLVRGWLDAPEADAKLLRFFQVAFQQDRIDADTLEDNLGATNFAGWGRVGEERFSDLLVENMRESFARTALAIVREGRPFTDVLTTRSFMMTTALQSTLAFYADRPSQDNGKESYRELDDWIQEGTLVWERDREIPVEHTLDPSHPDFMHFSDPVFDGCLDNPTYVFSGDVPRAAWQSLTGAYWLTGQITGISGSDCKTKFSNNQSLLDRTDFDDWKWVEVRAPSAGETSTMFWEVEAMRQGTDFVTDAPYVGFFSTPAFQGTWPTNRDNDARVTTNQALIVALGRSFDGEDTIVPASTEALLSEEHADPTTECYACHQTLDPMRQFFRQSMTYGGHKQLDTNVTSVSGVFAFGGVETSGDGIEDLAAILSDHEAFAPAWVQKLCHFANSAACPTDSAKFDDVVAAFESSGFDFYALAEELFASDLVTSATCVDGGSGSDPAISRQGHFCYTLMSRLGVGNACDLAFYGDAPDPELRQAIAQVIDMVPDDDYARGAADPVTIAESTLFVSQAYETVCREVADRVVAPSALFDPADSAGAIEHMVSAFMGVPENDARHAALVDALASHHAQATAQASPQAALASTFITACLSPSVVGIGF